jgi:hypothetical protein
MNQYEIYKSQFNSAYNRKKEILFEKIEKAREPNRILIEEQKISGEYHKKFNNNRIYIDFFYLCDKYFTEDKNLNEQKSFELALENFEQKSEFDPIVYADYMVSAKYHELLRYQERLLVEKEIEQNGDNTENRENINWSMNEVDFVRLVYALNKSGFVKLDKDIQLKLVEEIASRLDFKLSKDWVSNHSRVIKNTQPEKSLAVFKKMKSSYLHHMETIRNKEIEKNNK